MFSGQLRRLRLGARLGAGFTAVTVVLSGASVAAVLGVGDQQASAARERQVRDLVRAADLIKFYDADISGWQVAYAWDARRLSPAEAVAPSSANRAGFLADKAKLADVLASVPTERLTDAERETFTRIDAAWKKYFTADDQAAAAYARGAVDEGDAIVLGPGYEIYFAIVQDTDALIGQLTERLATDQAAAEAAAATLITWVVVALVAAIALAALLAFAVTRSITAPLGRTVGALRRVAEGDLTATPTPEGGDEVAEADRALAEAVDNTRAAVTALSNGATSLTSLAGGLAGTARTLSQNNQDTAAQAGRVSAAAEDISGNVRTVATGSAEMGQSIQEIAHNAAEAARVAAQAVSTAESTTTIVSRLGESSTEIASVVGAITSIAEQTNLLALNATIEAARAGESGKGFAVVANEVKELAQETAKATEDIVGKVAVIQSDTDAAVLAIAEISAIIGQISSFQNTIAAAVEEQTATTAEMARNVSGAATGSGEIAANASGVAQATERTTAQLAEVTSAAQSLDTSARDLRAAVERFRV
ncbi:methyl-accepting chemotaxis protein [Actinosynnema pretiosum]|uniref:Chemotaxis protein n=1 Tax=Actinosynnema pretiosum TaxID=42197 RepID=A0A290Z8V1_9PSEU|nr:methyl-accepting chemotaxis protein [Actinosynnema pretiosum]ATE55447.1 chemotaxis protein [Actinosynnema pretiosum]